MDQQSADGVRDALAELVEMLEERHPAFAGLLLIVKRREPLLGKVLVVAVLTGKRN